MLSVCRGWIRCQNAERKAGLQGWASPFKFNVLGIPPWYIRNAPTTRGCLFLQGGSPLCKGQYDWVTQGVPFTAYQCQCFSVRVAFPRQRIKILYDFYNDNLERES